MTILVQILSHSFLVEIDILLDKVTSTTYQMSICTATRLRSVSSSATYTLLEICHGRRVAVFSSHDNQAA